MLMIVPSQQRAANTMDSVVMTSPGPGTSTRLKSRLRSAANVICAPRTAKSKQHQHQNNLNNNVKRSRTTQCHQHHHRTPNANLNRNNHCAPSADRTQIKGTFMREIYSAWFKRAGHAAHISGDSVESLFNDMHLYPSTLQVAEMLQCARRLSRRNHASGQYLSFGEFCVFARELLKNPSHQHRIQSQKAERDVGKCEVFLGGSCNPTTWRADIAIPELNKYGISYYNPQVAMWAPELVAQEHDAKQSASVLLFVLDGQTRSVAGMIEVANLVASGRCVVLVIHPFAIGQQIMGDTISNEEYIDLAEGALTLLALVKSLGVSVHMNITAALKRTAYLLRNPTDISILTNKLTKLRETFDHFDTESRGDIDLMAACKAFERLINRTLHISELHNIVSSSEESNPERVRITFEQFCAIAAEFTTSDGCTTVNGWSNQVFNRQCSTNNNSTVNNMTDSKLSDDSISKTVLYDIYLGGSSNATSLWQNAAISMITKSGLTYFNPNYNQEPESEEEVLERLAMVERSKVLLFVITDDTRSLTSMILASHYIGLDRDVVLCVQSLPLDECILGTEKLTKQALKDYNRGRVYLSDLAKRKNLAVFENITEAVQCAIDKCS